VTIPMPGGFESLNAAAAAAISVYECVRQRSRRA
jgi:tRNA G18 (ribose-2'-O)-methylase SpoU